VCDVCVCVLIVCEWCVFLAIIIIIVKKVLLCSVCGGCVFLLVCVCVCVLVCVWWCVFLRVCVCSCVCGGVYCDIIDDIVCVCSVCVCVCVLVWWCVFLCVSGGVYSY
jgi:hypothetical protein